jgi:hypothetical protein
MSPFEHARRLELRDGDVVCLPADTTYDQTRELVEALGPDGLNIRCLIVLGDVHALDEAAMNAAGWYRK